MARVQNTLIGRASGSVGQTVFLQWKLINIVRSKPLSVSNPNTVPQQTQRNKFSEIRELYFKTSSITDLGTQFLRRKQTSLNAFLKLNIKNDVFLTFPPFNILQPMKLRFSQGSLTPTPISFFALLQFSRTVNVAINGEIEGNQNPNDVGHLIVYNKSQNRIALSTTNGLRKDLQFSATFDAFMNRDDVIYMYLFFVSASKNKVSDSYVVSGIAP